MTSMAAVEAVVRAHVALFDGHMILATEGLGHPLLSRSYSSKRKETFCYTREPSAHAHSKTFTHRSPNTHTVPRQTDEKHVYICSGTSGAGGDAGVSEEVAAARRRGIEERRGVEEGSAAREEWW